ncbi:MAG: hypothetical protein PHI06_08390 [Desulfobulbaceae bacterium]|nr:hypothetical protein [Desulfobulbaceae bacterium]
MATKSFNIIYALSIDHGLVLEFFAFFSRFEYSLKRSRFLKPRRKAEADWDKYANSIKGQFKKIENPAFQDAIDFLKRNPPKTQIIEENELGWHDTLQGSGEHHERYILRLIATIRNNLFHGGKFPLPVGPIEDTARNQRLLQSGITILKQCLALSGSVGSIFEETA